jgi:hypothetical protein
LGTITKSSWKCGKSGGLLKNRSSSVHCDYCPALFPPVKIIYDFILWEFFLHPLHY